MTSRLQCQASETPSSQKCVWRPTWKLGFTPRSEVDVCLAPGRFSVYIFFSFSCFFLKLYNPPRDILESGDLLNLREQTHRCLLSESTFSSQTFPPFKRKSSFIFFFMQNARMQFITHILRISALGNSSSHYIFHLWHKICCIWEGLIKNVLAKRWQVWLRGLNWLLWLVETNALKIKH